MAEHPDRAQVDDVYSGARTRAPRERLPDREGDPRWAYSVVHDELMLDGVARMNLATFCTTWAEPEVHRLLDEALDRNIVVPAYPLPPNRDDLVVQRVLVRHGVSRDLAELLVDDLRRALHFLDGHPPSRPLNEREGGGFNHSASPATA